MLPYFPPFHPGELLYSTVARLSELMAYPNERHFMEAVFGSGNCQAVVDLPAHVDHLTQVIPGGHPYTSDFIIDHYTLFPFYSPFLPPKRRELLRADMHGSRGGGVHTRAGIMASRVPLPSHLRFCMVCVERDRERLGYCFWHRSHQIPGISICPVHHQPLVDSVVRARGSSADYQFRTAEYALEQTPTSAHNSQRTSTTVSCLAEDAVWLLHHPELAPLAGFLADRYRRLLYDCDLATHSGRVYAVDLIRQIRDHYTPALLAELHCDVDPASNDNWIVRLPRNRNRAYHPLYHLLLIRFMGYSAATFFGELEETPPFRHGPWPCLNVTCRDYQQLTITNCDVAYSSFVDWRPIGTFSCPHCGFVYRRTGPDKSPQDRLTYTRVEEYGPVWKASLRRLWGDSAVSLREIGRRLQVDPNTVTRYASLLDLHLPRPGGKRAEPQESRLPVAPPNITDTADDDLGRYRSAWLAAMRPGAGVNDMRSHAGAAYAWLYRHDRTWLNAHKPPRRRACPDGPHVDWDERDGKCAQAARESALRLRSTSGRPQQITIAAIGRDIGQIALLQQRLDKLPQTAAVLDEVVESRLEYALRRIQWTEAQYRDEDVDPKRWEFVRRAGIARVIEWSDVAVAVDEALGRLYSSSAPLSEDVDEDSQIETAIA